MWEYLASGLIGFILGYFILTKLNPIAKTHAKTIKAIEELISAKDRVIHQLRGEVSTLQRSPEISPNITKLPVSEMADTLIDQITPSLPKWAKPFTGAISSWVKENPEKVQEIIAGLSKKTKGVEAPQPLAPLTQGKDY